MSDIYASIAEIDEAIQARLADVLEIRAADLRQQEMLASYLAEINLPANTKVLEVGCGTGAISRVLATLPNVESVIGVDPSPVFVDRAQELSKDIPEVTFQTGDGRSLDFADETFDLVVFHSTLVHVPTPEQALQEACRVLRPGGWLTAFEGDYSTSTVAIDDHDPLQITIELTIRNFVENLWLPRRLPKILDCCGFTLQSYRSHGYTQLSEVSYMLTLIDRGADLLVGSKIMGSSQAEALRTEARRRIEAGEFFGHISFISAIARRTK